MTSPNLFCDRPLKRKEFLEVIIKLPCYFCRFDGPSTRLREVDIFTSVSFCPPGRAGCAWLVQCSFQGVCMPGPMSLPRGWEYWGTGTRDGVYQEYVTLPLGEWDLGYRPPSSSTGHNNTYHWQAGGTHSTGMLSCFVYAFLHFCTSNCNPENSFHPSRPVLTTVSYSFSIEQIIPQQRFFAIASCRNLFRSDLLTINIGCLPIF